MNCSGAWLLVALTLLPVHSLASLIVNSDAPGTVQNEVSAALNLNPQFSVTGVNLIFAYNDDALSGNGLGVSYSFDSGVSWSDVQLGVPSSPFGTLSDIFDPITGADTLGNLFAGYIATDGTLGGPSGLFIERSTDGGANWSGPIQVAFNNPSSVDPNYRFNDKPHLVVDTLSGGLLQDNVYVAWIQDDGTNPQSNILFASSSDNGLTFGLPVTVNDNPGGPNTDLANGPNAAVAANGTVYVAWLDVDVTNNNPGPKAGKLMFDKSTDGGATFGMDVLVKTVATLPNHLSTLAGAGSQDDVRARGYPVIAVDPNDATGQTVYMVYAEDPDGTILGDEADIYFIKSIDGGLTWSQPLRVNDDSTTNDQFAPWMTVKADGTIDVVWYDKRNSVNDDQWDVYFANSVDGGQTFQSNRRVTSNNFATAQSSIGEPWLGEYLGIVVDSSTAYIGYSSTLSGDSNGDIFFDAVVNAPAGPVVPEPSAIVVWASIAAAIGARQIFKRRRKYLVTGYLLPTEL